MIFNRKKKKEEIKIFFKKEDVKELVKLYDAYAASINKKRYKWYLLWSYINNTIPETNEGYWTLKSDTATRYYVIKRDKP